MSNARIINPSERFSKKAETKMTGQNYGEKQRLEWVRRSSGIRAFKILKVEDGNITVPLPKSLGEGKTATFKLVAKFDPKNHAVGNYVDLILSYTIYSGSVTSFRLEYVGLTPQEFVPRYGEPIGN